MAIVDESTMSPVRLAVLLRQQWSDEHLFQDAEYHPNCQRCSMPWNHTNHCTREQDKAAVMAMADRIRAERGQ